jgi:hypothetical protein
MNLSFVEFSGVFFDQDFLIVDANQNQVFVAADHEENLVTLYLSEPTGQFFVPTLENIVSDQESSWLQLLIDLYEVRYSVL